MPQPFRPVSGEIERVRISQLQSNDIVCNVDDDDLVSNDEINEAYAVRDQDWQKVCTMVFRHADVAEMHLRPIGVDETPKRHTINNPDSVYIWRWVAPSLEG